MTNLKITELNLIGSELFDDSENFLEDLTDDDLENLQGAGASAQTIQSVYGNSANKNTIALSLEDIDIKNLDPQTIDSLNRRGYNISSIGKTANGSTYANFNSIK
jgi:hypothetical protein